MKMKFRILSSVVIAAASTLLLGSCSSDPDSSGLEYMPDMYRSAAIEPYVDYGHVRERENPELKLIQSAKTPPSGTVPFYGTNEEDVMLMLPYARKANKAFESTHGMLASELTDEDTYLLAAADKNPLAMTAENSEALLKEGKQLFKNNCAHCHGAKGDGNGPMVESGAYAGVPDYANLKDLSDGQMFYSIYYGKGAMGSHKSIVNKKEIWTIIHYIRSIQDGDYGKDINTSEVSDSTMVVVSDSVDNAVTQH